MVKHSTLLFLLSTSALVFAEPVAARQLNRAAPPAIDVPSDNLMVPYQDELTTIDPDGTKTTVYRTRHRIRKNEAVSGYSTGSAASDAFTGALLGNVLGEIISDEIGGHVQENKQFRKRFPDPLPPPPSPPAANIGDLIPTTNP